MRIALLLLLLLAAPAGATGWPQPAAGDSASGDIEVIFTFDDGPNPTTTPLVLDLLKARGIHAVFFLVGDQIEPENKKAHEIVQRILAEGHVIANHTQRHSDLCRGKDDARAAADIDKGKATIEAAAKVPLGWFRAPYGVRCARVDKLLEERGITHFHWDWDPQEWKHGNVDKTVKYVTGEMAHAHGREVLLMHDIKQVTPKALPLIFAWVDEENAKRAKSRKHKITFFPAPMLAVERLPAGLVDWLADATSDLRALPRSVASVLPAKPHPTAQAKSKPGK